MRKILVAALGALALAGCVHHEGPYRGAGYGSGGYGYQRGYVAPPRRTVVYQPVYVQQPVQRRVEHRRDWRDRDRDRWRDRRQHRDGWWRGG